MFRGKRGLSEVVTTLIIILLVLVAVGVVWAVVSNLLSEGSSQIDTTQFSIDVNFLRASVNGNNVNMTVERASGQGNITGLKFILSDGFNSETFDEIGSLTELQQKTFTVTVSLDPATIKTASVAPIYVRNNEEVVGGITDTYNFGGSSGTGNEGNGENGGGNGGSVGV